MGGWGASGWTSYFWFGDNFDGLHLCSLVSEMPLGSEDAALKGREKEEVGIRKKIAELQVIMRTGRGESFSTLKHLVIGSCFLPVLFF